MIIEYWINRKIYFEDNELEIEALKIIAKFLQGNQSISRLILVKNQLTDNAGEVLAPILKDNKTLVCINLISWAIRTKSATLIWEAIQNNETLTEINFSSLQGLYRNKIGVSAMAPLGNLLKTNKSLTILNLEGNCICDEGLKYLINGMRDHNKTLIELNIALNYISCKIIEDLSSCILTTNLERLNLESNKIGNIGIERLSKNLISKASCPLRRLNICDTGMESLGMNYLSFALKKNKSITHLNISENDWFSFKLKSIVNEKLDKKALLQKLEESDHEETFVSELFHNLVVMFWQNKALKVLEMNRWWIENEWFLSICEGLTKNQNIESLSLSHNKIDDDIPDSLATLMNAYMTNIKILDLSHNKIGSKTILNLAETLKINKILTQLNLENNEIDEEGGLALADIMKRNLVSITFNSFSSFLY